MEVFIDDINLQEDCVGSFDITYNGKSYVITSSSECPDFDYFIAPRITEHGQEGVTYNQAQDIYKLFSEYDQVFEYMLEEQNRKLINKLFKENDCFLDIKIVERYYNEYLESLDS